MTKIFEDKKFKLKQFKEKSEWLEVKEPYSSNGDFTYDEINEFIYKNTSVR